MTAKNTSKAYGNASITALKGADRVRKRPSVIFGADNLEGCEHSFFEILSNSVDEAREGHGDVITVTAFQDLSIEVDDRGRGVPLGFNAKEGRYNWELIFCELYAGGKYDNNKKGAAYEYSLGLNGLGACATQYASEYMDVWSFDGQEVHSISFKKGNPASELQSRELEKKERRTGTVIRWRPDREVFTDIHIPHEFFKDVLYRQAVVNSGIKFVLRLETDKNKFEEHVYFYKNGIIDYVREKTGDTAKIEPVQWHLETQGRDSEDRPEYKMKADITFSVSNTVNFTEYYHNSSFLEHGGSPDKAVRAAFPAVIDAYLKSHNKYKKGEKPVTFEDVQDCLVLVINSFSTMTSYENQTKKSITNQFIRDALRTFIREQLNFYLVEHPAEAEIFANQVLINKRSRETAEKARYDLKERFTNASNDFSNRVEKFVDCRTKDPTLRELYIVEGDSALTSCKLGRSPEFQAIIPVRGKTLNCVKAAYDRIFKNDIIKDLLRVIGCGVEVDTKKVKNDFNQFDLSKLRWSKIIICTDADEDGFQIRTLLLTLFYRLLPTLLQEKKVFIAESPLFEITTKDEILFAYNEFEKADILKKLDAEGKKYTLQRSKGLGENEPEMMWQTTMNPATRRLVSVEPADVERTEYMFDVLMGDNLAERKVFIAEHGSEYIKDADI
ncbi:MAG: DNA topoisomerase [Clostridia bacterium]|nr:DNA topoisomerase [Clostridia bacterium]